MKTLIKLLCLINSPLVKKDLNPLLATKMLKKIKRLHVLLQKMTAYRKDFNETKYVPFLITDDKWLRKYNEIWEKVTNIIYKELDSDPVYNKKYIKTKIKPCNGKINAHFQDNKIPIEGSHFIFLSIIWIDSFLRTGKNCYPQVFLEECKYVVKEKKICNYLNVDAEISSYSDENNSYEENSDEDIL